MNTAELWTDGSAGNHGSEAAGWAYVLRVLNESGQLIGWRMETGYLPKATSQAAELKAIERALHAAWHHEAAPLRVRLYTDSQYGQLAVLGIQNVQSNHQLVGQIKDRMDRFKLMHTDFQVEHVPAHTGFGLNDLVDGLAKEAAKMEGGPYYGQKEIGDKRNQRAVRRDAEPSRRPGRKPATAGQPARTKRRSQPKNG